MFDIVEIVPQFNNPQTNHKLKLVFESEEKSPVTALCGINGYIAAAIGPKVIIHSFDDSSEEITGIAFIDVNIYVTSLTVVKNLILCGDLLKSCSLLAFQEEPAKVTLVGKDFSPLSVTAVSAIVDDGELSFLVADNESNLHILQYNPYNITSIGGVKLIRRGDIHTGSKFSSMIRLRRMMQGGELSRQHFNLCGICY